MQKLLLFILALGSLILLLKWRVDIAQKIIEGKEVPDTIKTEPKHPDGVLYYFYHPKCGPCRQMQPTIDHLIEKYPERVKNLM